MEGKQLNMTNMKVSKKLLVSFLLVIVLTLAVGAVGIYGMMQINEGSTSMYERQASPMVYIGEAIEYFQRIRVQLRNIVVSTGNNEALTAYEADLNQRAENFIYQMGLYLPYIEYSREMLDLYEEIMATYDEFSRWRTETIALAGAGEPLNEVLEFMNVNATSCHICGRCARRPAT